MKKLVALLVVTAAAALVPFPASMIERHYSRGFYPRVQWILTTVSNAVPVAFGDVAAALLLAGGVYALVRAVRARGVRVALGRASVSVLAGVAVVYLCFLVLWGLNYRRAPLETSVDFDRGRITPDAAVRLAAHATDMLNGGHAAAHRQPFSEEALTRAFVDVQSVLGLPRAIQPGRPKASVLQVYFRAAAINGMTVPYFLEVILNPDLLAVEVPATLAHEWAHLAGYADEAEANFVAWLACVRSEDPLIRYSGWLEAYGLAMSGLPRGRRVTLPRLAEGPRQDLRDIGARLGRSSPLVRTVARDVYDSYLKANRVDEGIASYGAALQLMLGTRFDEGWRPVLSPTFKTQLRPERGTGPLPAGPVLASAPRARCRAARDPSAKPASARVPS